LQGLCRDGCIGIIAFNLLKIGTNQGFPRRTWSMTARRPVMFLAGRCLQLQIASGDEMKPNVKTATRGKAGVHERVTPFVPTGGADFNLSRHLFVPAWPSIGFGCRS
jgi:hypothetical protein